MEKQYKLGKPGAPKGNKNNALGKNQFATNAGHGQHQKFVGIRIPTNIYDRLKEFESISDFVRDAIDERLERLELELELEQELKLRE